MASLQSNNSVFQAEFLATQEAFNRASQFKQSVNIWSDSESAVKSISCFKTKSPIAQDIQAILLNHPSVSLIFVKAHVGIQGNEAADNLAERASTEGTPPQVPGPRSFLKKQLHTTSLKIWQDQWDNGTTGRSIHQILSKVMTTPEGMDSVRNGSWSIFFLPQTTQPLLNLWLRRRGKSIALCGILSSDKSFHFAKPSDDMVQLCVKEL
ncbi:hypothetical protein AVEN_131136-1 [Araneus ventricosus]|uniref:RNase H type-1 domain-containing protein n=1 Tax=Araneus ventricosus TaxID=182803 RepID=A0A4Y2HCF3_ARAVE|nr:hypothetical protein AVEN_131136-1 [Araneus ventricosus]